MTKLVDLREPSGPPLTTGQLASAVGLSSQTIRTEIALGELRAVRAGPSRVVYRIPWSEARRYAAQIGVLSPD